jgi:hypothetical protein
VTATHQWYDPNQCSGSLINTFLAILLNSLPVASAVPFRCNKVGRIHPILIRCWSMSFFAWKIFAKPSRRRKVSDSCCLSYLRHHLRRGINLTAYTLEHVQAVLVSSQRGPTGFQMSQRPPPPAPDEYESYSLADGTSVLLVITRHPTSSKPAVVCDLCGKVVEKSALGGLTYFHTHRGSAKCQKAQRVKCNQTIRMETQAIVHSMVHRPSFP